MGVTGLFIGIGDIHRDMLWLCLYLATIVLGLTMLSDTFIVSLTNQRE
jgi:hypothetical protein